MCLVRVSKDDEPDEPPRIYVRRRESVSHSRRTSQVIIRPTTTSRHSVTRITSIEPAPRPAQYVDGSSGHNSGEVFIVNPPVRERSRSPGFETRGRADSHAVRHVSVSSRSRDPSREPSRERRSQVHLTAPLSPLEVDKVQRGLEASRDTMMVEDIGGPRESAS
ncbi:hypothetical protein V495_02007 [Pseudogymnoascus sp. VKM F-4514 (FW-929)]|nr:hypothetical protein V495_02007 [Pseudogymnoascus sp. VKM F-4514 (FW-929)]